MAIYKVDIEKFYLGEYWTNVYYVDAATLTDANDIAVQIVPLEEAITLDGVLFTKYRTSDLVPGTDNYITTVINENGDRVGDETTLLPLFNVMRFDLNTLVGRPSRKYMRGVLTEADIVFNAIDVTFLTSLDGAYGVPLAEIGGVCDNDGQAIVSVTSFPFVGMRQLRRGSKRKAVPVIP